MKDQRLDKLILTGGAEEEISTSAEHLGVFQKYVITKWWDSLNHSYNLKINETMELGDKELPR